MCVVSCTSVVFSLVAATFPVCGSTLHVMVLIYLFVSLLMTSSGWPEHCNWIGLDVRIHWMGWNGWHDLA